MQPDPWNDDTGPRPHADADPTVERPPVRDQPTVQTTAPTDDPTVEREPTMRLDAGAAQWAPPGAQPPPPPTAPPPWSPGPGSYPGGVPTPPRSTPPTPRSGGGDGRWRPVIVAALVSALVSAGVTLGLSGAGDAPATPLAERVQERQEADAQPVRQVLPGGSSVADVAAQILPSVAQVDVVGARGTGSGSAVVYREDGYLVTNNHVVTDAQEVEVVLADGTRLDAEVEGTDPSSDLAILRVPADDLPVPVLREDPVRVGETVIAVGSPFGLESTVTSGIVSALERAIPAENQLLVGMLQTDAAINPGNSGGPLVDDRGQVIGINTAIFSQTGQSGGIGFAIPAITVRTVAEQLLTDGTVEYAQLGVEGADVTPQIAERFDLPVEEGAVITDVLPGSGADEAGLRAEDIIVRVDGTDVRSQADLYAAIRGYQPGDEVEITYVRDGEERTTTATLQVRPEDQ